MAKTSFREQVLRVREDAIVAAVNRLLAEKGFEAMTVDEVAAEVGIAKASLYKHFTSKEALAATAMVRVLDRALQHLADLAADASLSAVQRLRAVVRWAIEVQLAGQMPSLPAQNSALRTTLMTHPLYLDRLVQVSDQLGEWIMQARADGALSEAWPPELVLYTIYARACDPVIAVLKATGQHSDERIVELLVGTCFEGLGHR